MTANDFAPKAADIAYLRFQAPDLDLMQAFLQDFGLMVSVGTTESGAPCLYSQGSDRTPYVHRVEQGESKFLGVGFKMASLADLEVLATKEGASEIVKIDQSVDGRRVRFTDPHGYQVDGVVGWEAGEPLVPPQRVAINSGENRQRLREPVRLNAGPATVKRLGHCVLFVENFRDSEGWYKDRFGFVTSDEIYAGSEANVIGAFLRCDRGDVPVDHHTVFLLQMGEQRGLQHAAFEVNDWDDVMLGHDHLKSKNHTARWGIGKHILGSQVFDYWLDPYGNNLEHFSDGDLFDVHEPPGLHSVETLRATQWGPGISG